MFSESKSGINITSLKLILILAFLGLFLFGRGLQVNVEAQTSPDAIAIRVIANPNHYSAQRWYAEQEFTGSPQTLIVDGYGAVRDGRTVYVNVANVVAGNLYTNIYLISYNQEAERDTIDIFGRILDHWKFNTNLVAPGFCRKNNTLFCLIDENCPTSDFCDSPKARLIRDTDRLADLAEVSIRLERYKDSNGTYPTLAAGTYLPGRSLSVWPSWRNTLGIDLGTSLPTDPVNKIGPCPADYNADTCWNEVDKSFVNVLPNIPMNSLMYSYLGDAAGASFHLCAVFESGLNMTGVNYVSALCPSICLDFDGDGYGNPGSALCSAGSPLTDCNDTDPAVTTGSAENTAAACSNGIDDDCDGYIDCNDLDCNPFCGAPLPSCGNFSCDPGECATCPSDCGIADCCPNGFCEPLTGENSLTCPMDCPGVCGNSVCESGECSSCPGDCSVADCCPNGTCDAAVGENSLTCAADCVCTDADGDNWYLQSSGCDAQPLFAGHNDCDDTNANIHPTHPELCDGLDNDCDGLIDEGLSEEACSWVCTNNGFTWVGVMGAPLNCCGNDLLEAGPYEVIESSCSDGRDNDCNGLIDNLAAPAGPDPNCAGTCFGASTGEHFFYVFSEDPDCNQCDLDGDQDGDQSPSAFGLDWVLHYPGMADMCDPDCRPFGATIALGSPAVHIDKYEAVETRCDGLDNDCDGVIDEGCDDDADGYCDSGMRLYDNNLACPNTPYAGPIDDGKWGDDCDDTNGAVNPAAIEICGDGLDNDCTGGDAVCAPACTDNDGDLYIAEATDPAACGNVCGPMNDQPCIGNNDCNDLEYWVNPGGFETCDLLDNDCDGTVDEGCDDDGDGYCDSGMQMYNSNLMCLNTPYMGAVDDGKWGNDCDDNNSAIHPTHPELCDGLDNNCSDPDHTDGVNPADIDEGISPDACQHTCEIIGGFVWTGNGGALNCCGNGPLEAGPYEAAESSCSDGRDNDCNGLIDSQPPPTGPDPNCAIDCAFTLMFPCNLQ